MSFHKPLIGDQCEGCNQRLKQVDIRLVDFFSWAKEKHPDLHIAQAWRGEDAQNQYYAEGKTRAKWPHSPHNHMSNGAPCSRAIDVFQMDEKGEAIFDDDFCRHLYGQAMNQGFPIQWGGNFKSIFDGDHFELLDEE